jgi:hypothetical protein
MIRRARTGGWVPEAAVLTLLLLTLSTSVLPATADIVHTSGYTNNCLDGGPTGPRIPLNVSVAVIKPIFTSTPYSQYPTGSFYAFYKKYVHTSGNITTDLDWLVTSIKSGMGYLSGWGHTFPLYEFLASDSAKNCGLVLGRNLVIITDINVTQGALFNSDGSRKYDAVIIGHQEYVTQNEYDQVRLFVAAGGKLIAMSSNMFYARVAYNSTAMVETFLTGHGGYAFNGRTAFHTKVPPFSRNTSEWFGSSYCCFRNLQFKGALVNGTDSIGSQLRQYYGSTMSPTYVPHEENAIGNFTNTHIVATFTRQSNLVVASYVHRYGRGAVYCLCVFGEDVIADDPSTQFFLVASVTAAIPAVGIISPTPPRTFPLIPVAVAVTFGIVAIVATILISRRHRDNGFGTSNPEIGR